MGLVALAAAPAPAQQNQPARQDQAGDGLIAPLAWPIEELYTGWRASDVLGAEAVSRDGVAVGTAADIVLDFFNEARYLVVAVNPAFAAEMTPETTAETTEETTGETTGAPRYAVNWGQVRAGADWPGPITLDTSHVLIAETLEAVPPPELGVPDEAATGWRIADLIGAPVEMDGGLAFGVVDDVLFDDSDAVSGIVVDGTGEFAGLYPVPWEQVVVEADAAVLSVPLTPEAARGLPRFDHDRMAGSIRPGD